MDNDNLGGNDKARNWYVSAVEWMEKNEELRRFRQEAEEL